MANGIGSEDRKPPMATASQSRATEGQDTWRQRYMAPVLVVAISASVVSVGNDWWARGDAINTLIHKQASQEEKIERLEVDYREFKLKGARYSSVDAKEAWDKFYTQQWLPLVTELAKLKDEVIRHNREAERYKQKIDELYERGKQR